MVRALLALWALPLCLACSRTVPDTQWPPPGPSDGLPHIPMEEADAFGDDGADPPESEGEGQGDDAQPEADGAEDAPPTDPQQ